MSVLEKEEIIGLSIILLVMIGLVFSGHLTDQAVSVLQWVGSAFMASKGISNLLPSK